MTIILLLHCSVDRFYQYKPTSLERSFKYDLLTEHDLDVTIDLINPDTYKTDADGKDTKFKTTFGSRAQMPPFLPPLSILLQCFSSVGVLGGKWHHMAVFMATICALWFGLTTPHSLLADAFSLCWNVQPFKCWAVENPFPLCCLLADHAPFPPPLPNVIAVHPLCIHWNLLQGQKWARKQRLMHQLSPQKFVWLGWNLICSWESLA